MINLNERLHSQLIVHIHTSTVTKFLWESLKFAENPSCRHKQPSKALRLVKLFILISNGISTRQKSVICSKPSFPLEKRQQEELRFTRELPLLRNLISFAAPQSTECTIWNIISTIHKFLVKLPFPFQLLICFSLTATHTHNPTRFQ